MKNKKKNAVMAVAALAMMGTSMAFFTDYVSKDVTLGAGTLAIQVTGVPTGLDNMAPGDEIDISGIQIVNVGTLDAEVRATVAVEDGTAFGVTGMGGTVGKGITNVLGVMTPGDSDSITSLVGGDPMKIVLDETVGNEGQGADDKVSIIVEARQQGKGDWSTVVAETIITTPGGDLVNP